MATNLRGYTTGEVLNKVLNTSSDSLKVDIVSGAEYAEDSAHTDEDTGNFVLGVRNDTLAALGGSSGDYVPFQMNASGALYVETTSIGGYTEDIATPSTISGSAIMVERDDALGALTPAEGDWASLRCDVNGALWTHDDALDAVVHVDDAGFTLGSHSGVMMMGFAGTQSVDANDAGAIAMDTDGAIHIADGGNTITVDGTVSVSGLLADGHNVTIDNASSNEVYVRGSGTAGSADAAVLTVQGIASGTAQPVSLASVPSHAVTNAGTFAVQSTLAASDGTDIGDVDVTSIVPGTGATNLGKAEDAAHSSGDTGVMPLAVRNDDVAALGGSDGDYAPLQVNAAGSLYTADETGQAGSILVTGTTAVTSAISNTAFVAIQFIEDSVFDSGNAGLISSSNQLYPSTQYTGTDIDTDGGAVADSVTFPQGMTIFGRWSGFTLASGKVIAYIGYV